MSLPPAASAVYTALFGGYERLNDDQELGDGSVPFICFTDDPTLTSSVWDVVLVEPLFAHDLQRSQRNIKIRGHRALDRFERTLYIDNSVSLTAPASQILDDWLSEHSLALPLHNNGETVADGFRSVFLLGLDDSDRVREQLRGYTETESDVLTQSLYWGGMIARRNEPAVAEVMARWYDEVLRYSRRDQLSVNVVFSKFDLPVRGVEIDNAESAVHRWPVELERNRPPKAAGWSVEQELGELRVELEHQRAMVAAQYEVFVTSTSWRLTRPLRWLSTWMRKGTR